MANLTPEPLTVTLTAEKIFDSKEGGGSLYMTIADCIATAHDPETDQELGRVGGAISGALVFQRDSLNGHSRIWAVRPDALWKAFQRALDLQESV